MRKKHDGSDFVLKFFCILPFAAVFFWSVYAFATNRWTPGLLSAFFSIIAIFSVMEEGRFGKNKK